MTQARLSRREQLIAVVTARLQRVCAEWPAEEFAALVLRVVETTLKYEGTATPTAPEWVRLRRPPWGGADLQ
jgi:hypothetical protein